MRFDVNIEVRPNLNVKIKPTNEQGGRASLLSHWSHAHALFYCTTCLYYSVRFSEFAVFF